MKQWVNITFLGIMENEKDMNNLGLDFKEIQNITIQNCIKNNKIAFRDYTDVAKMVVDEIKKSAEAGNFSTIIRLNPNIYKHHEKIIKYVLKNSQFKVSETTSEGSYRITWYPSIFEMLKSWYKKLINEDNEN